MRGGGHDGVLGACGSAILVVALVVGGCGKPPPTGLADLYARRPDLSTLDTAVLRGRTIVIDPGHGGSFGGSRGAGETRESDVNLGVALYLWGLLRDAGADVHLTRASDRDLLPAGSDALRDDLAARVARLDSLRPDVFLSLHHNSNAALDRERNAIETYFKLGDAGPSYDLARAIHRRLAGALGIERGAVLPGNYYVLRHADTAAVLGEASYLSHPAVESKLRLAEKQLLEAEAYFLGLIDYFARGVPRIVADLESDTLLTGALLELRVDSDVALDPLSVRLHVDGREYPLDFDAATRIVTLQVGVDLAPGPHDFELRARNLHGNAARAWRRRLRVYAPPARLLTRVVPESVAAAGDARVDVRVLDAWSRPVADGTPVAFAVRDAALLLADSTCVAGEARAYVRVGGAPAHVGVRAATLRSDVTLHVSASAAARRLVRCIDARTGAPLREVELRGRGCRTRTDRHGAALVDVACDTLRARKRGYVTRHSPAPGDAALALHAVLDGRFLGARFVLDAGGDGNEPTEPGLGISTAELSWQVTRHLGELLDAAGAAVRQTRGAVDVVPDVERVRLATTHAADWYVRVEHSLHAGRCAQVLHYPNSRAGVQLARHVAARLRGLGACDSVGVRSDPRYVLQQTPCPAIVVQLPGPATSTTRAASAHPDSLRRAAAMLLLGLRAAFTPDLNDWTPLEVRSDDVDGLAILDGVEAQRPDAQGRLRFEHVAPGTHHLLWVSQQSVETWVETVPGDTTYVQITTGTEPP